MKLVIFGCSVAGLHTALYALNSELEADVTVLEKKKSAGERIVCAGGLSSYMIRELKINIPDEFVAAKINHVRFYSPTMKFSDIGLRREYGVVIRRDRWERWLAQRVEDRGGKLKFNVNGLKLPRAVSGSPPKVYWSFREFPSDVIVGADGITGMTRKLVGLPFPQPKDIHIGIQGIYRLTGHPQDTLSLFFSNQLAPGGYCWVFPQGNGEFRVGLGVPLTAKNVSAYFERFLAGLRKLDMEPAMVEPIKAKLIPTAKPPKTNVHGNIAFVGDAGLFTDASTGGGIGPAILSAQSLVEALSRGGLEYYDKIWRQKIYRRNNMRYALKNVLMELDDAEWEMLVGLLKDFKPMSESVGWTILHLIVELAIRHPSFTVKHKLLRTTLFP